MGHWNYRIVKYKSGDGYGLHEVYYDDSGAAWSMTSNPVSFGCDLEDGPEGVLASMRLALQSAESRDVFDEPKKWLGLDPSAKSKNFKL